MKLLLAVSLLALTLTTGFTCSKNTPEAPKTETPAQQEPQAAGQPSQEQMAQPVGEGADADSAPVSQPAEGEAKQ
ncbi:MAG: acylneuraminate cytidylyltransferase [Bdellovibrionaceae bacterium]|nr:acylneuraminate cytidylyltransferase [Pseudobdellovibrionaceae bacterium]